jgi:hypothetical protein
MATAPIMETLNLSFAAKPSKRTPPEDFRGSTAWSCTFRKLDGTGRRLTVPFYMGSGHGSTPPTGPEVLDCLASDASLASNGFAYFCGETGAYTDSRKAERSFRQCQRIAARLQSLLGADYDRLLHGDLQDALQGA